METEVNSKIRSRFLTSEPRLSVGTEGSSSRCRLQRPPWQDSSRIYFFFLGSDCFLLPSSTTVIMAALQRMLALPAERFRPLLAELDTAYRVQQASLCRAPNPYKCNEKQLNRTQFLSLFSTVLTNKVVQSASRR